MEMLYVGKLYCFVWLGLIFLWYFRGKIIVFILLLELYIVGSVIWVEVFLLFVFFEGKRFCFGFWEILWNIEDSIWVYFIFKKWSWLCENENCLGVVKNDLKCDCLFFDWKIDLVFFLSLLVVLEILWMKYVMSVFYRIFIKNGDVVCKKVI